MSTSSGGVPSSDVVEGVSFGGTPAYDAALARLMRMGYSEKDAIALLGGSNV